MEPAGRGCSHIPRSTIRRPASGPRRGTWVRSGEFFTLISLGGGNILAAGGTDVQLEPPKTTEVREPGTGEWSASGKMSTGRERGAAVLLGDGRVLYTGGKNKNLREQDSTEIFDPASGEWTEAAPMGQARSIHTATLLLDGRVLVVGGGKPEGPFFATAEVYDPSANTWTQVGSMRLPRILHTATLLPDGRVLVVGGKGEPVPGIDSQLRQTAEIYDPQSGEWSPAGEMAEGRAEHTATVLSDGAGSGDRQPGETRPPRRSTIPTPTRGTTPARWRRRATGIPRRSLQMAAFWSLEGRAPTAWTINAEVFTHGAFAAEGAWRDRCPGLRIDPGGSRAGRARRRRAGNANARRRLQN